MRLITVISLILCFLTMSSKETIMRVVELEFSDPQLDMLESTAQINLFHAGVGSGKTHIIGARNAIYAKDYPHVRGFIGANTYQQLSKSTLVGVFKFWGMVGIKRDIDYVVDRQPPEHFKIYGERLKKYDNTISFSNGKLLFLGSLENYEMIDGQEFAHADLDETKDSPEAAITEVILPRLRQKGMWLDKQGNIITDEERAIKEDLDGFNPLNIHTSPAKTDWIAEMFQLFKFAEEINATIFSKIDYFRKRIGNMLVIISSTYHNEHNLPKGYIEEKLIKPNAHNEHRVKMLVYGSPLAKSGNEYHTQFDRMVHVKEVEMPADVAVHISFDFNRVPYITSGLYKIWFKKDVNRWHVHKFDEVCLMSPDNTTEHLCKRIIDLYSHIFRKGVFYYGDYSGKNRRTNSVDNDYDVIERLFDKYIGNDSDRVIVNQPVVNRKEFINKIHFGSHPIDFTVSARCINTIADFEFLQEGPDGGKLKKKVSDGNGGTYEKYGHCSDETEYILTSAFNDYFNT